MSDEILKITGMEKTFRGRSSTAEVNALRDISLTVSKGEFVTLRGPSGCGKSTLLLAAGTLLRPDKGEVIINGSDPYNMESSERATFRAKNIGFVFQRFCLVPYLKVLDNVMLPELATGQADREKAVNLLDRFGLSSRIDHHPSELSVGEQQRVALARAVSAGASLILADEPTGNLDSKNGQVVLEYLSDFTRNGGAVFMVTHDQIAVEYASRSMNMLDGRLAE